AEPRCRAGGVGGLIARALRQRRRNRQLVADTVGLPRTLIVAEEKQFILPNRSTHGAAKLFEASARQRLVWRFRKGIARLLPIAAPIQEGRTVETIGARLGLARHDARDRLAELRVGVL